MSNLKILIIGIGNLGFRYLQGISKINIYLEVYCIDLDEKTIENAKKKWNELTSGNIKHKINWIVGEIYYSNKIDIAIIATTALNRHLIIQKIYTYFKPNYWIIEKVLAQSSSEVNEIIISTSNSNGAWVNNTRRICEWHNKLKNEFETLKLIKATKNGNSWGLACNSIHFIDLISWWCLSEISFIDDSYLDNKWFISKRDGFYETSGLLKIYYQNGTQLLLNCSDQLDDEYLILEFESETWLIDETKGVAHSTNGKEINGNLELQSNLTASLLLNIVNNGSCNLPTLNVSAKQHTIYLSAMLKNWNKSHNSNNLNLPIT